MFRALTVLALIFPVYCLPLLSANELTQSEQQQFQKQSDEKSFEINYDKEFIQKFDSISSKVCYYL